MFTGSKIYAGSPCQGGGQRGSFRAETEVEGGGGLCGRAQRVGVFNFGTDRVRVLEKIFRDGSGTDRVRVFSASI